MLKEDTIRLVVAEDHEVYRYGLEMLFREHPGIELVGAAATGTSLIELTAKTRPDVVLVDLRLPEMGGVEAIGEITRLDPAVKSVAISTFDHEQLIVEALDAGALGYLSKNSDKEEIIEAVLTVHQGFPYYCRKTTMRMIKLISSRRSGRPLPGAPPVFTEREKQVIKLICRQKTSREIGRELFLSGRTIEKCRLDILEKMGERTTIGVVLYAIRAGLFTIE